MRIPPPNYTQTPNEFFDDIAKTLKEGELRVLLVVMRQTFGWQKDWDQLSITQLMKKTGMERRAVCNSLNSLIKKGLLEKMKEGSVGKEKCWYQLCVDGVKSDPKIYEDDQESYPDSNSSYQYPKDTPTSILKIPTKETNTKEIISPIVPKGDPMPRKSKREEKAERAPGVFVTPTQEKDLLRRIKGDESVLVACYDKLSAWKISKEISGGKNDYKAIIDWVINAVLKEGMPKKRTEEDQKLLESLKAYVDSQKIKDIHFGPDYIEFEDIRDAHFKVGEPAFKEKILNTLRKLGIPVKGVD